MKKSLCLYLSLLFIALCNGQIRDQHSIDSLVDVLQQTKSPEDKVDLMSVISMDMSDAMPMKGLQLGLEGEALAREIKYEEGEAACFNSIGWDYYRVGKTDSAKYYLEKAKDQFHQLRKYSKEAKSIINLCSILENEDNDEKSLSYSFIAMQLFDSSHDELGKAYIENMIGIDYRKQGAYDKAIIYNDSAIEALQSIKEYAFLIDAYDSRGNIYLLLKKWDSAIVYYDKCISLSKKIGHQYDLAYTYSDKALLFLTINKDRPDPRYLDSALSCYTESYNIFYSGGMLSDAANQQLGIGETLVLLGKNKEAKDYLDKALTKFIADGSYNFAYEASEHLSELYKNQDDYKNAFYYLNQSLVYKDSVNAAGQKKTIDNLLIRYETDKKDKSIQLLNTQKELADKELSRNKLVLFFSLGLTVLLIVIGVILRKQNLIRQQLKEVQMRHQIASDLHDDVGSSLSSILLLSKMAQQSSVTTDKSILDKIGTNTKEVIDKMSDIVWTMKPGNDEGISLKEKLEKLAILIREISGIEVIMNISDKLDELKLNMHTRKNIFLICKEATNNLLKHSKASKIEFYVDIIDYDMIIVIKDNGKGFDKAVVRKNNGMDTMQQRAKDCNGTCSINSIPEQGTVVSVKIPIPHSRYRFS
jgi:two-component system sensor histidine kinase UhpB